MASIGSGYNRVPPSGGESPIGAGAAPPSEPEPPAAQDATAAPRPAPAARAAQAAGGAVSETQPFGTLRGRSVSLSTPNQASYQAAVTDAVNLLRARRFGPAYVAINSTVAPPVMSPTLMQRARMSLGNRKLTHTVNTIRRLSITSQTPPEEARASITNLSPRLRASFTVERLFPAKTAIIAEAANTLTRAAATARLPMQTDPPMLTLADGVNYRLIFDLSRSPIGATGVLFARAPDDSFLVIKPVECTENVILADHLLTLLGVRTIPTRFIPKNGDEATRVRANTLPLLEKMRAEASRTNPAADTPTNAIKRQDTTKINFFIGMLTEHFMIMEKMGDRTMKEWFAEDPAQYQSFFKNPVFLSDFAKMVAADLFCNNSDRFIGNNNLGNYMATEQGQIITLDNAAKITEAQIAIMIQDIKKCTDPTRLKEKFHGMRIELNDEECKALANNIISSLKEIVKLIGDPEKFINDLKSNHSDFTQFDRFITKNALESVIAVINGLK